MSKNNISDEVLNVALSTLLDHCGDDYHPFSPVLEGWIEDKYTLDDINQAFLMARNIAASGVPYVLLGRLPEMINQTLINAGEQRFSNVLTYGIDTNGANARYALLLRGTRLTGSTVEYAIDDPDQIPLSGCLYSISPDTSKEAFQAALSLIYAVHPEQMVVNKPGTYELKRVPANIRQPANSVRCTNTVSGDQLWLPK